MTEKAVLAKPTPRITKAIIPAAGLGTRFLPATKASPKEMMPIIDKPIIQYVVEEAVKSGIKDVILVTGMNKRAIEDHFDRSEDLERFLKENNKTEQAREIRRIAQMANFIYLRQKGPYGNGTPVLCAKHLIGEESFLVLWGDEFTYAKPPQAVQLIKVWQKYSGCVLGCIKMSDPKATEKYGFVKGNEIEPGIFRVNEICEKPGPQKAPSKLAAVSGYLLTPQIFPYLEKLAKKLKANEELYLTRAINLLAKDYPVYAVEIKNAHYYDCGDKLEYLKAQVDFGLARSDINGEFKKYLQNLKI